jgi:pimeloyl-ACP methyl ester carboxylesterase
MTPSVSHFHEIRGLRYHVRTWGDASHRPLFLLHGWMDVSASFQFLVDAFKSEHYIVAPDWRGFGLSGWCDSGYWFADYYADLDALLDRYQPAEPVDLAGHSMGGNVACMYAGIRPERVARLISLDNLGMGRTVPGKAPDRYALWLSQLKEKPAFRTYASYAEVAARLQQTNPRLADDKADFLARHWAKELGADKVVLTSDPRHKNVNPYLFRIEEALACWRRITAPVLLVTGDGSTSTGWGKDTPSELAERTAAFRNLRQIVLADSGHMMHHDQPAELARHIEAFLASG